MNQTTNIREQSIEQILNNIGIYKSNSSKRIAYEHWYIFTQCLLEYNGEDWKTARHKMRARVQVDHRYLSDYLDSFLAFGIVEITNGKIAWKGIPAGNNGNGE